MEDLGIDISIYTGNKADYTLVDNGDGTFTLTDNVGSDGADILSNIEYLKFFDITVGIDVFNTPTFQFDSTLDFTGDLSLLDNSTIYRYIGKNVSGLFTFLASLPNPSTTSSGTSTYPYSASTVTVYYSTQAIVMQLDSSPHSGVTMTTVLHKELNAVAGVNVIKTLNLNKINIPVSYIGKQHLGS